MARTGSALRQTLLTVVLGLTVSVFSARADEVEALLWMVDDPDIVAHGTTTKIAGYTSPEGMQVTQARVAATTEEGDVVFLNFAIDDGDGGFIFTDSSLVTIQSGTGYKVGPFWAAYVDASTSTQSIALEEFVSFQVCLGTTREDGWHTLAVSESETYGELASKFVSYSSLDIPTYGPWMPTTYTVPEPSGALLVLIGGALLALRHKREEV